MKNAPLILNVILLVLVGVLFYLHFSDKKTPKAAATLGTSATADKGDFKIGYFEWDSLENQALYRDMQNEINKKEEEVSRQKMQLRQGYQNKVNSYSQRELSQVESENATRDIQKMEMDIRNQMQTLDQQLQDFSIRKQKEFKTKVEDFLKEYNASKGYSFVFAYEPALIFYRDTVYNITKDLVQGLNQKFPKK